MSAAKGSAPQLCAKCQARRAKAEASAQKTCGEHPGCTRRHEITLAVWTACGNCAKAVA